MRAIITMHRYDVQNAFDRRRASRRMGEMNAKS
jgi:hypothetical protein